jgi:hypothetical protein
MSSAGLSVRHDESFTSRGSPRLSQTPRAAGAAKEPDLLPNMATVPTCRTAAPLPDLSLPASCRYEYEHELAHQGKCRFLSHSPK